MIKLSLQYLAWTIVWTWRRPCGVPYHMFEVWKVAVLVLSRKQPCRQCHMMPCKVGSRSRGPGGQQSINAPNTKTKLKQNIIHNSKFKILKILNWVIESSQLNSQGGAVGPWALALTMKCNQHQHVVSQMFIEGWIGDPGPGDGIATRHVTSLTKSEILNWTLWYYDFHQMPMPSPNEEIRLHYITSTTILLKVQQDANNHQT